MSGLYRVATAGLISLLVFVGGCSETNRKESEQSAESVARLEEERDKALIKECEETLLPGLKSEDNMRAAVAQGVLGLNYKSSVVKHGDGFRVHVKNRTYMSMSDSYIYNSGICDVVNGRFSVVKKLEGSQTPPE